MDSNNNNIPHSERIAVLEYHFRAIKEDFEELKKDYKEDMGEIKRCLRSIEDQTSSWKNFFWGITTAVSFVWVVLSGLFHWLGIDIAHLFGKS